MLGVGARGESVMRYYFFMNSKQIESSSLAINLFFGRPTADIISAVRVQIMINFCQRL